MKEKLTELLTVEGDLDLGDVVVRLAAAVIIAMLVYLSYRLAHSGSLYSRKFNVTLVGLALVTTTVMIVIGSNLAMSLGMVGALSIVRYRTAVKDSRDTLYIFWAIVVGICCGAGDYLIAAVGSIIIFAVLLFFGKLKSTNRMLLIVRTSREKEGALAELVSKHCDGNAELRVKNTTPQNAEFIYEISRAMLDKAETAHGRITDAIYGLGDVEYVNIVAQSDEIGG